MITHSYRSQLHRVWRSMRLAGFLLASAMLVPGIGFAQELDPTLAVSFDDTVRAIAVQPDGTIIVGGRSTS